MKTCHLCGLGEPLLERETWHRDHVQPRSRGGGDEPENLAWAHGRCNEFRRDKPVTVELLRACRKRRVQELFIETGYGTGR